MKKILHENLKKLGSIMVTAMISALIAWLQAILTQQSGSELAQASPEVAGATGAILRGAMEAVRRV